ncbi:MAG: hypothetical protein PHD61_07675 [Bacteroidales bacterium]|nr:hypothetical protein [Lentimicrobiaceae bacterium]MDD5695169.1 hypothetical protein [Bacteroidales bacterium]
MIKPDGATGFSISYRFFIFDTVLNYGLAILFIFFFRQTESFISKTDILPDYFWIAAGTGLLLFGFWQTFVLLTGSFRSTNRLISCILSWLCFIALTYALIFIGFPMKPLPAFLIWIGDLYMLFLGVIYFVSWYKSIH